MVAKLPAPVVSHGRRVHLEPLAPGHVPKLSEADGGDAEVRRRLPPLTPLWLPQRRCGEPYLSPLPERNALALESLKSLKSRE